MFFHPFGVVYSCMTYNTCKPYLISIHFLNDVIKTPLIPIHYRDKLQELVIELDQHSVIRQTDSKHSDEFFMVPHL